ncbi:MAG: lipase maturation factor family protein, partial [Deltaproteobacteria bacterium]|nr:lipase maturation factor family protein [Deltaproteobacteria bacterium]
MIVNADVTFADTRPTYVVSSWLFARVLGGVLSIAFLSLGVQAKGLFGSSGVMPILMLVEQAKGAGHSFWQHPSALWWGSGDTMIGAVWVVGMVAALAVLLGFVPKLALAVSWFAYLSFVSLGWPFMSFQWDVLLLEVSFTAFFFVPLRLWDRPSGHPAPHPIARWALWWLLFRLV